MSVNYDVPTHQRIPHCSPAAASDCACPGHAADKCILCREGGRDSDAAFCQIICSMIFLNSQNQNHRQCINACVNVVNIIVVGIAIFICPEKYVVKKTYIQLMNTRSSAIAYEPRDALCQLKYGQLLHSCTKNPS